MRQFEYFLFENFDADDESANPYNPRRILGRDTDPILSSMSDGTDFIQDKESDLIGKMITAGVVRWENGKLKFDCPIFLREDATTIHTKIAYKATELVDILEKSVPRIQNCCRKIDNGFPVERNLYHILCGMVFDGRFFDYLSENGAVATARQHPSGLDYLTAIYEKCPELQDLSNGILCSYNRFVNAKCSLQSFGDAMGNRFDFYRFFRLMEQETLSDKFKDAAALLDDSPTKDSVLDEVDSLLRTGRCAPGVMSLLELFGYTRDGLVCVPVFKSEHERVISEIEGIVENTLGESMSEILSELAGSIEITAVHHGVNRMEIANELYHLLFGYINEELVKREIVAAPAHITGEGRYFKCIEMYDAGQKTD